MKIFMIPDYFRINGLTGGLLEEEYAADYQEFGERIVLRSARNQFVSLQIVLDPGPEGRLERADIDFTDLRDGDKTLKADYEAFTEWFHRIDGKLMPDMLIPFRGSTLDFRVPLDRDYVPDQRAGALWVDLFVPAGAEPGTYKGAVTVTADGQAKAMEVVVRVYDCEVPSESRIISDFNNYADSISVSYPHLANNPDRYRDGSFFEVEAEFVKICREHRCLFEHLNYLHSGMPVESFAPELEGSGRNIRVKSWELFDRHFGPYLDGSVFKDSRRGAYPLEFCFTPFNMAWPADYRKFGKEGYRTEYRRILWEFLRHFEEKGWTNTQMEIMFNHKRAYRFMPSNQDEMSRRHDEEIAEYMYNVIRDCYEHSEAKFLHRADTSNYYHDHSIGKFSEMFDMYVAWWGYYSWFPDRVAHHKTHDKVVWIYGGFDKGMTIDLPLHAHLSYPMMCFKMGASGFCSYWNAVGFGDDYLGTPFVGGGQAIMYPGTKFGCGHVLPTIRLKALRNHMQLVDLMMTVDGTDNEAWPLTRTYLDEIVNGHYGRASNRDWWVEPPECVLSTEPRFWRLGNNEFFVPHKGQSPVIVEKLRKDVLRCLDYYNRISP